MLHRRRHDISRLEAFSDAHIVSAGVGFLAMLVALLAPLRFAPLSPLSFALMGPAHWAFGHLAGRRRVALVNQISRLQQDATV